MRWYPFVGCLTCKNIFNAEIRNLLSREFRVSFLSIRRRASYGRYYNFFSKVFFPLFYCPCLLASCSIYWMKRIVITILILNKKSLRKLTLFLDKKVNNKSVLILLPTAWKVSVFGVGFFYRYTFSCIWTKYGEILSDHD